MSMRSVKKKDEYAVSMDKYTVDTILALAKELGIKEADIQKFATANIDGTSEINIESELKSKGETSLRYYKYEGPPGQREFCAEMVNLDLFYTEESIKAMSDVAYNPGFGLGGASTYSIWDFKGGPNCKHRFVKYEAYIKQDGSFRLNRIGPVAGLAGKRPIDMPNQGYAMTALRFADEEQKIVVGPAMIPEMAIPRRDEDGDIYYVKFSEETIKEIMMKFMKEARTNATNQDHQEDNAAGAYVYESWLVEDPETDKANTKYGFNVPAGTWMVSMKVDDKETWKRVKNGELRGFSVEGFFSDLDEIQGLKKYIKIMKILKD